MIKDMSAAQLNNDMREIFTAESQQHRPAVKKTVNKNLSNDVAIDTSNAAILKEDQINHTIEKNTERIQESVQNGQ